MEKVRIVTFARRCKYLRGGTVVAAVHPHAVAVVPTSALHDVVGVVRLRHLTVWIYDDLRWEEHKRG